MANSEIHAEIAVIGAGIMGTGIAHAFLASGSTVNLIDIDSKVLSASQAKIGAIFDAGVKRGKVSEEQAQQAMDRLGLHTAISSALHPTTTKLAIETVSESSETKIAVCSEVDKSLSPEGIIATNTSALSVTEIASATSRPGRFIGMHFFNPVHKMKLVELVRGMETSDETVEITRAWVDHIGKSSITVTESPGLTTSRMSALLGNEAMYMLSEGVASAEDIDKAMRGALNHPMGPLELGDLTGWDTRLSVLNYLHQTLGEKYRPCPLIIKLVKAGRLGRKTGRGIYVYDGDEKVPNSGIRC